MGYRVIPAERVPRGLFPQRPLEEQGVTGGERFMVKNLMSPASVKRYLEGMGYDVWPMGDYEFAVRPKGSTAQWSRVDPSGFDLADLTDFLGDIWDMAGMTVGAVASGVPAAETGPGAVAAASWGAAKGGAGATALRLGLGKLLGAPTSLGEAAGETVLSGVSGAGGEVFGRALGAGLRYAGRKLAGRAAKEAARAPARELIEAPRIRGLLEAPKPKPSAPPAGEVAPRIKGLLEAPREAPGVAPREVPPRPAPAAPEEFLARPRGLPKIEPGIESVRPPKDLKAPVDRAAWRGQVALTKIGESGGRLMKVTWVKRWPSKKSPAGARTVHTLTTELPRILSREGIEQQYREVPDSILRTLVKDLTGDSPERASREALLDVLHEAQPGFEKLGRPRMKPRNWRSGFAELLWDPQTRGFRSVSLDRIERIEVQVPGGTKVYDFGKAEQVPREELKQWLERWHARRQVKARLAGKEPRTPGVPEPEPPRRVPEPSVVEEAPRVAPEARVAAEAAEEVPRAAREARPPPRAGKKPSPGPESSEPRKMPSAREAGARFRGERVMPRSTEEALDEILRILKKPGRKGKPKAEPIPVRELGGKISPARRALGLAFKVPGQALTVPVDFVSNVARNMGLPYFAVRRALFGGAVGSGALFGFTGTLGALGAATIAGRVSQAIGNWILREPDKAVDLFLQAVTLPPGAKPFLKAAEKKIRAGSIASARAILYVLLKNSEFQSWLEQSAREEERKTS